MLWWKAYINKTHKVLQVLAVLLIHRLNCRMLPFSRRQMSKYFLSFLLLVTDYKFWRKIMLKKIQIRKKLREFPKRNPVHKLPQSQCHQHMLGCQIYIPLDKMRIFKVRWTTDSETLLATKIQVQKLNH